MFRGGSAKPDQGAEGSRKPSQSPEAQRAYNQMRDVEEGSKRTGRLSEALRQRERDRRNVIGHSPYLEIPTPHRRPRSRTGSIGSTGPASTQGSDGGVEDSGRKRRGHRTKPLEEPQRLRTAFIRTYVGACGECRTRKVKCTHFDDAELEANYQALRRSRLSVSPSSPSLHIPISPPVFYSPVQCPNELVGVGSHTVGCPNQPIVNHHEHLPDDIVLESPSTLVNTSMGGLFLSNEDAPTNINAPYSPSYPAPLGFDDPCTPFPNSYPGSPMLSSPASSIGDVEKPLGLLTNDLIWECKRGATDPWTVAPTDSGSHQCHARFPNHIIFLEHYRTQHEPFVNEKIVHRCKCCGSFEGPFALSCTKCQNGACLLCDASGPLDTWYYGTMMPPAPSLTSGTSTITTGQGFGNGLLGPSPSFFGSNSYGPNCHGSNSYTSNSYGIYGSSYAGSTSNQTFGTASVPTASEMRRSEYASSFHKHQVISKHDFTHPHHNEHSTSPTTKKDHSQGPFRDHDFPQKSFAKCASPTTFSLILKSAKSFSFSNVNLNFPYLPYLALAHYLILLLLLLLGSSDANTTTTSSSSLIKRAAEDMPLVSAVFIVVGVLGMWWFRSGGHAVGATEVIDNGRGGMLPMSLIA